MAQQYIIPDGPHFEPESTPYFLERLAQAREYLEYGSGGSTVEAARLNKTFTSVESDAAFLEAVQQKIGRPRSGRFIHVDIGKTTEWGIPKFQRWTPWRRLRWSRYAKAPWHDGIKPDLILVDGRFRVHCALYTINQLRGRDFEILLDDYTNRDFYSEVESFAELQFCKGRMASFLPKKFDQDDMNRALRRYSIDFR